MSDIRSDDIGPFKSWYTSATLDELLTVAADAVQPGRLVVEDLCGHQDVDGMKPHPLAEPVGPTLGDPNPSVEWCKGGSRRIIPTGDTE